MSEAVVTDATQISHRRDTTATWSRHLSPNQTVPPENAMKTLKDLAAVWILSGATLAVGVVIMQFIPA